MQRVARDLPVLLALSASSPFWNGQDTGYASIRTIIWQRWPSAGATGRLGSAAGVRRADRRPDQHRGDRRRARWPTSTSDPRPTRPTLELRVCDACPIVDDAVLIAGLFRGRRPRRRARASRTAEPFVPVAAADPPGRDLAGRPRRAGRRAARRHPAPASRSRPTQAVRGLVDAAAPAAGGAGRLGRGRASWPRPRWPAATRPTGSAPRAPSGASWTTWSNWWSTRPRVRPEDLAPAVPALRTLPLPGRRRGGRARPSAAAGLPRHRRLLPRAWRPQDLARARAAARRLDRRGRA